MGVCFPRAQAAGGSFLRTSRGRTMERKLKAEQRTDGGKGVARKLRASGRVPGVVYGHGDAVPIDVDARDLYHLLHTDAGMNVLVDLKVGKDEWLAMPRDVQRDNIRDVLLHVDFLRIARDETITVEVPVHIVGDSHGVREGGVVEHHLWNLQIECLPQDVPTSVEADVSPLGIGESLKVSDLAIPKGCTILTSVDEVVVSVVTPQVLKVEEEVAVVEGEAVEGEAAPAEEGAEAPGAASAEEGGGGNDGS
jgi:large subunit ribosomal protein L25